jgi:glycosyltransferase involved in cell wall biosynthesis
LRQIESQTYNDIEVVVSDDCSTDNTETELAKLKHGYKYDLKYFRSNKNLGYDKNLRKSLEIASGDYCFILGNDDTLNRDDEIEILVGFLIINDLPDIGFCNYSDFSNHSKTTRRAFESKLIGTGKSIALRYYSCFSFVAGIIIKSSSFRKFNTDQFDGSIYVQIYLATTMIASGCRLFAIERNMVLKDITIGSEKANSYLDFIPKKWSEYRANDGGMHSVINVLTNSIEMSGELSTKDRYTIYRKIYSTTYPYWILDYKQNGAFPAAVGLIEGMFPTKSNQFVKLNLYYQIRLGLLYVIVSIAALLTPVKIFNIFKERLYKKLKSK